MSSSEELEADDSDADEAADSDSLDEEDSSFLLFSFRTTKIKSIYSMKTGNLKALCQSHKPVVPGMRILRHFLTGRMTSGS